MGRRTYQNHMQSQILTMPTKLPRWLPPLLIPPWTARGRADSRWTTSNQDASLLFPREVCSGACLTGARNPQSWGWGRRGRSRCAEPGKPVGGVETKGPNSSQEHLTMSPPSSFPLSSCPLALCHHYHLSCTGKKKKPRDLQMLYTSGGTSQVARGGVCLYLFPPPPPASANSLHRWKLAWRSCVGLGGTEWQAGALTWMTRMLRPVS